MPPNKMSARSLKPHRPFGKRPDAVGRWLRRKLVPLRLIRSNNAGLQRKRRRAFQQIAASYQTSRRAGGIGTDALASNSWKFKDVERQGKVETPPLPSPIMLGKPPWPSAAPQTEPRLAPERRHLSATGDRCSSKTACTHRVLPVARPWLPCAWG